MTTEMPFRVTDACNAHCRYCEAHVPRATEDLGNDAVVFALADALERHRGAHGGPASLLRLLGGEPLLQRRMPRLLEVAHDAGVGAVWLDTNGLALAGPGVAAQLAGLGLSGVRVGVHGGSAASADARMRREGAFALMRAGLRNAVAAGLGVELAVVGLPDLLDELEALLDALQAEGTLAGVKALWLHPFRHRDEALAALHPTPRALEPALQRLAKDLAGRRGGAGIALRADPALAFHPCAFARPRPLAGLLRGAATGASDRFVHLPPCADCTLRPRCDGVERSLAAAHGEAVVFPQRDGRRALWAGVQERTRHSARTDRVDVRDGSAALARRREHVIRVNHACNQRCRFCWVDFEAGELTHADVLAALAALAAQSPDPSAEAVAFTGGEPTLRDDLAELIAAARAAGLGRVHLQTNAVRLADAALARRLADAGLSEALVSLHADEAAASDAITALPGSFERTLAGIDNLIASGVDVVVNHVLTRAAAPRFSAFVDRLAALAGAATGGGLTLTVAVASHIDRGPLDPEVLPTQTELAAHVRAGLLRARALGLRVRDLAHPCGFALCVLDPELSALDLGLLRRVPTAGRLGEAEGCVKPAEPCGACAMEPYCFGLRAEYASAHGFGELRPFAPAVGVVGVGAMGRRYLAAAASLGARTAAVARHDGDRAAVAAVADVAGPSRVGAPAPPALALVPDAATLAAAGVGLVVVAVQTPRHHDVAAPLLAAGHDVLVEKPLAADLAAAEALLAAAAEPAAGRLFVAHTCTVEPVAVAALGALGAAAVRAVRVERREVAAAQPGALATQLVDVLVHDLGVFAPRLGDDADIVEATWCRDDATLEAALRWGGADVRLRLVFASPTSAREVVVEAVDVAVTWRVGPGRQEAEVSAAGQPPRALSVAPIDRDAAVLGEVIDALAADRASPLDGRHGVTALAIAEAIVAAAGVAPAQATGERPDAATSSRS